MFFSSENSPTIYSAGFCPFCQFTLKDTVWKKLSNRDSVEKVGKAVLLALYLLGSKLYNHTGSFFMCFWGPTSPSIHRCHLQPDLGQKIATIFKTWRINYSTDMVSHAINIWGFMWQCKVAITGLLECFLSMENQKLSL